MTFPRDLPGKVVGFAVRVGKAVKRWANDENGNILGQMWEESGIGPLQVITTYATGSPESPGPIPGSNVLFAILFYALDSTGVYGEGARIQVQANENFTGTAHGTKIRFLVVPTGLTGDVDGLIVTSDQVADNVSIQVRDASAAALKQVSRGAADSGGAGFRLLRIPN